MEVSEGAGTDADGGGAGAEGAKGVEEEGVVGGASSPRACALQVPGKVIMGSSRFQQFFFMYAKCRNLPFGGRATRDSRDACSTKGIRAESPPTFI